MGNGAWSRIATFLIVLASSVAARPAPAVEFNCAKAFLKVDFVICRSAEGMKAIGDLQAAWDATYATTAPDRKALLVREQRGWIRAYAAECGVPGTGGAPQDPTRQTDVCVIDRIQRRTVELRAVASGIPGQADGGQAAAAIALAPVPVASAASSQTDSSADSIYPMEQLLHPNGGLRPLRIRVLDGRPVFNDPDYSPDQQAFFRLITLGMKPGLIEERDERHDRAQDFAMDFLPFSNSLRNLSGADEFKTDENRKAFLAEYADRLRALAPRAPFEFVYQTKTSLPPYDRKREGFVLPPVGNKDLQSLNLQEVSLTIPFEWPTTFWSIKPPAAQQLLARLEGEQRDYPRSIRIVAVLRAVAAEPQTMRLDLRLVKLSVYNNDLTRELYRFDAGRDEGILSAGNGIAALLKPPPGIRPWSIRTLDGLPVFDASGPTEDEIVRDGVRSRSWAPALTRGSQLGALSMLIAAGSIPGEIEANPSKLAEVLLTDDVNRGLRSDNFAWRDSDSDLSWKGDNEFERQASKTRFLAEYAPLIRQVAPKPPFRFLYSGTTRLGEYDTARGGFPFPSEGYVQQWQSSTLSYLFGLGRLVVDRQFSWPEVFWPVSASSAPKVLQELLRSQNLATGPTVRPEVRIFANLEATALDPSTRRIQLKLNSLRLYTPDLSKVLYEFPVINDAAALSAGRAVARLRFSSPVVFDDIAQCAELIDAFGDRTPADVLKRCFDMVAARDAQFYEHNDVSAALPSDDARRPFFPRGGPVGSPAERAAFIAWAKSYAAGLPDTVLTAPIGGSGAAPDGSVEFPSVARVQAGYGQAFQTMMDSERLQSDQIVSYGEVDRTTILMVLPNSALNYGVTIPKSAFEQNQAWRATAQSVIRLGRPRIVRDDSGGEALAINVTPIKTVVSVNGKILAERSYEDVPRLDAKAFTAPEPPSASRPIASGPIKLEAAFIDLLAASAVGERLSREAQAHLVARRWLAENARGYAGRRFFVVGKRAPSPTEAADLGPAFARWAKANTPALPFQVFATSPIELANNDKTTPWGSLACLRGTFDSQMQDVNRAMTVGASVLDCARRETALTTLERRRCAAASAASRMMDFIRPFGGECRAASAPLNFSDPLNLGIRLSHDLPTPGVQILGGRATLMTTVTFTLTGVEFSNRPPDMRDSLPESIKKEVGPAPPSDAKGEFVTLNAKFVEASYLDPRTHSAVGTLGPESGVDIAGIERDYEKAAGESEKRSATPTGPYGPDLLGIRLGMSFGEAEAIVRQHMSVGQVFQGTRAFDVEARNGFPKPFTSGKLFLAADGQEMIALVDEPPAAPETVMAAWRRNLIKHGTTHPSEVLSALQQKYGPPTDSPLQTGIPLNWHSASGARCAGAYNYGKFIPLSESWSDNGTPGAFAGEGMQTPKGPMIIMPLFDPLNEQYKMFLECGPFVTAQYLETPQFVGSAETFDTVDTMLTDIDPYRSAYARSRKMLQDAAAAASAAPVEYFHGAYGPDLVGIELGMSFAEAEAAVRQHMAVAAKYRRSVADDVAPGGNAARLPGSGVLFVSAANDEMIGVFDAPPAAEGRVVAVWRRIYSPLAVDFDLVTRRSTEKYGPPAFQDDGGRLLAWGAGPPLCGAGDAAAFDTRATLDARWTDEKGEPLRFHAANGEDNPTMPVIAVIAAAPPPGQSCAPRVRLVFRSEQGDPPMNVTETTLTDLGQQARALQASREPPARSAPVKF